MRTAKKEEEEINWRLTKTLKIFNIGDYPLILIPATVFNAHTFLWALDGLVSGGLDTIIIIPSREFE